MLKQVKRRMDSFGIAPPGAGTPEDAARILCAVSGGADSVCLLLALLELGYQAGAVHVEHGIRKEESLADCAFVRRICEERKIPLRVFSVDAPRTAASSSMTLEEAARQERWKALRQAAADLETAVVATAHHRMDQAETVLWNLIRGTSSAGLGGIRPCRPDGGLIVIRPLIDCTRQQIEAFLEERGVSWRTDSTNLDTGFTRNAIRLKVLPLLRELNPEADRHIAQAAEDMRDIEEWLLAQTDAAWNEIVLSCPDQEAGQNADRKPGRNADRKPDRKPGRNADQNADRSVDQDAELRADRTKLQRYPGVLRHRLQHRMIAQCCCGAKDITRAHVLALDHLTMGQSGREISLPGGVRAVSEEEVLRLTRKTAECGKKDPGLPRETDECGEDLLAIPRAGNYDYPPADAKRRGPSFRVHVPGAEADDPERIRVDVRYMTWPGGVVPKKKYTKYLAYDTMAPCLVLRTRRSGDYLYVNASLGRKKLKDYLIDEKVPRGKRDSILLIAQGSHVLWVVGMRISEKARVSEGDSCVRVAVSLSP